MTAPRASAARTLAVSIGNTSLFAGVFTGARLGRTARFAPAEFDRLLAFAGPRLDSLVLCSVVPARTATIVRALRRATGVAPLTLDATAPHGLAIGYREPARLGADRVAAALGARARFPNENLLVVDFGTATTVTALRRDGALLGGAILPGLTLAAQSLHARTAQLPLIPARAPRRALGRAPEEAIASGVFFGQVGAVRELVARLRREAFGRARVRIVATGGHAPLFRAENLFDVHAPHLVLEGLRAFAARASVHAP